jgi:antitoxin HigA-1
MAEKPEYPAGKPQRAPTHPGELWQEILYEHLHLPIAEAARRMGVSRQALYAVLRQAQPVTPEMALRFGRLVDADPELYVRMQAARDLWFAEERLRDALTAIAPVKAA